MSKQKKNRRKDETTDKKLNLITAVINLIIAVINIIAIVKLSRRLQSLYKINRECSGTLSFPVPNLFCFFPRIFSCQVSDFLDYIGFAGIFDCITESEVIF